MKLAQLALVFAFFLCLAVVLSTVLTGCGSSGTNPTPTPTPAPTPGTVTVSATELALIQTGSTVATGAVLNFAVTQPASRTQLANQIYASASALYQASGGTPLTPTALNTLLASYSVNGLSQYTQYVTAVNALYQEYYTKYVTNGSTGVQNFAAIVNAIAQGAEAGASSYATVTAAAASNSTTSTWQEEEQAIVRANSPRFKIESGLRPIFGWRDPLNVQLARE